MPAKAKEKNRKPPDGRGGTRSFTMPLWKRCLPAAALVLLAGIVYLPVIHMGFIWDDDAYLTQNATLRSPNALSQIWAEPAASPQYYPLVFTSFLIEKSLWGLRPLGYHIDNVLLHAVAAVLLWRVLRGLQVPGAWLAAAVFVVHPVHIESVAWVTERKNVLSATMALASMLVLLPVFNLGSSRSTGWRYAVGVLLFICALLSKTVTCALPAVLLVVIWWKRARVTRREVVMLLPLFALGVGFGLMTAWLEHAHVGAAGEEWALSWAQRCLVAGRVFWFYPSKLIWPAYLVFVYPRWQIDAAAPWQYLFPLATTAALVLAIALRNRIGRGTAAALLAYACAIFPASGFINVFPMRYSFVADHFQYHASMVVITLLVTALTAAFARAHKAGVAFAGITLVLFAARAWAQMPTYKDAHTLWLATLERNPQAWVAHLNLARMCEENGQIDGAIEHLQKALQGNPRNGYSHQTLANLLVGRSRFEEAIQHYREGLKYRPDDGMMHHNLANLLSDKREFAESTMHYHEAMRLRPTDPMPRYGLAELELQQGRDAEATALYREALTVRPKWRPATVRLAWLLATSADDTLRNGTEALTLARTAVTANPRDPDALDALAAAFAETGDFTQAVQTCQSAVQLARGSLDANTVAEIDARCAVYSAGRAYHRTKH